jgi:hypothetical protein
MKNLKKTIASLALAAMLLPTIMSSAAIAQETPQGPFGRYGACVSICVDKYDPWTWSRIFCAADCYMQLVIDLATLNIN